MAIEWIEKGKDHWGAHIGGNDIRIIKFEGPMANTGWHVECLHLDVLELFLDTDDLEEAKKEAPQRMIQLLEQWLAEFHKALGDTP